MSARLRAGTLALAVWMSLSLGDAGAATPARADTLIVPAGKRARVDGVARPGEWADADTLEIQAGPDWMVPVLLKHDGEALYVAFSNLVHGREERYPEVMLDVAGNGGGWDDNDWWLHVSNLDCTGRGFYGVYGHTCAPDAEAWYANNFPLWSKRAIEIRVSLGLVGLSPDRSGALPVFGLALAVAESESRSFGARPGRERRFLWPLTATMTPGSWAPARLAPIPPRSEP